MKNRLSKLSRKAYFMLLLLAVSGVSTSCKDEYTLDDEKPTWLSTSLYDGLEASGRYTNYLRLLNDPDVNPPKDSVTGEYTARPFKDVLQQTGSKTIFVADDDAWKAFFENNALRAETDPWHTATSYENLSLSQKNLLMHTSMLNNAIVMENLSSSDVDISTRGDFLRRYTDVKTTDSVTYLDGNSLPINYNQDVRKDGSRGEKDYWWRFRTENGGNGIHLVSDSSVSMMLHFTNEYLSRNNVTDEDFEKFMGRPRVTSDVHIYDAQLLEKDGVAENGFINKTEKVLMPLPNMAELIRTNGKTKIFSHMLDRWSAPFYNATITEAYKEVRKERQLDYPDSVFVKRYFSDNSYGHAPLKTEPITKEDFRDASSPDVTLKFDPGWNTYVNSDEHWRGNQSTAPQYDMAAMFVPDDETLWRYFNENGGGWQLIRTYYLKEGTENEIPYTAPATYEDLYRQIDQIPLSTLRSLINVIMFPSFVGSVPSKMTKLRDDAQEQIFFPEDVDHIKSTLLANNGMIYVTDKVYGPADYTSVAAPAYISNTNLVMRWAIYNGSTSAKDYMGLNYYAYLKAMQSDFALFLPSDDALQYYFDPVSFKSTKGRILHFFFKNSTFPIDFKMYAYNNETGEIGQLYNMERMSDGEKTNRLKDILESHTLVLDSLEEIDSDIDEYYLAKNGAAVKVTRANDEKGVPHIVKVQGGFQLENEDRQLEGFIGDANRNAYSEIRGIQANHVTDEQIMSNGRTYILDSPIIPASHSVYSILTNDGQNNSEEYNEFYNLCTVNEEIVRACGLVDETNLTVSQQKAELKKYQIFISDNGPDYNVQFFNNYRYTIFVPTTSAIQDAIANGLPTWDEIEEYWDNIPSYADRAQHDATSGKYYVLNDDPSKAKPDTIWVDESKINDPETHCALYSDSIKVQAMITYLINFVRYHFADNSVFVDKSLLRASDFVTASYDNDKGLFCKINIRRPQTDVLEVQDSYTDENENVITGPWIPVEGRYNIMARDVSCSSTPAGKTTMNGITIDGSSFAVIHQINKVLNHTLLKNGRHDSTWATTSDAKKYLKRYAITH